jgi:predicted Rossmann fold flavoprotein
MDIVIIGGGASGLVAAITASKNKNNKVTLIEKNQTLGKKILATGNGKCNYYNSDQNLSHYNSTNTNLIKEIITKENTKEIEEFFSKLGIIPKIKNGYYYPFSNQATTIRNALVNELNKSNIKILDNEKVTSIKKENNKFIIKTENNSIKADKVIISTGSKASPKTGSDGMGYDFLKEFNHTIIKPLPALVQLKANASYLKEWSGIRTDIKASLYINDEFIKSEEGEIQLTNYGISGICIFNLSRFVSRSLNENKKVKINLNFIPMIDNIEETLSNLNKSNKTIKNLLDGILNSKLVDIIIKMCEIETQDIFISAFYEKLLEFCQQKPQQINIFLKYWADELKDYKISLDDNKGNDNENDKKIKLFSVHKSKGLEFPVVIIPFFDWQYVDQKNKLWIRNHDANSPVKLFRATLGELKETNDIIYTTNAEIEEYNQIIDTHNLMYVAFTRPKHALSTISKNPKSNICSSDLLTYLLAKYPNNGGDCFIIGNENFTKEKEKANVQEKDIFKHKGENITSKIKCTNFENKTPLNSL